MATKPNLHLVPAAPRPRAINPDHQCKRLLQRRAALAVQLRDVDRDLAAHGRRLASERGLFLRLTIDQLRHEFLPRWPK